MSDIPLFAAPAGWTARRGLATASLTMAGVLAIAATRIEEVPVCVALGLFGCVVAIANARIGAFHAPDRFGPANTVTLGRAAGAALLGAMLISGGAPTELASATAGFSGLLLALDGIDGWLARRTGLASPFGARFDMEVDAATSLVLSALVWQLDKAGPWVLAIGLMRYAFLAAGTVWPWLTAPLPPSIARKAVCVLQLATLTLLMAPGVTPPLSGALAGLALAALACSFARDIRWLSRR